RLLGVAQERRVEYEVDAGRPVERIIGSVEDVIDADLRDEVPQAFLAEDHRVDVELRSEILARLSCERSAVGSAPAAAQRVRPPAVRRQIPASVCRAD